jgi:predicted restriction endonuclease
MKKFRCHYPCCNYETNEKSHIDYHHIKPVHLGGNNKPYNLISLCPTHHRCIFIETEVHGIHSIKTKVSIEIKQILESTNGRAMIYKDMQDDKERVYYFRSNTIIDW